MRNFLKVAFFSLLVIGLFAGFANFGIPRIEPAPPPTEEKIDLGSLTMDQFLVLGEKIYKGKGTCTLCHNALGGRAPLLEKAAAVTAARLKDARYKGDATDIESYLVESMIKPSAFVVAGFGKKGTQDAVSPMPDVSAGSIGLNEVEIAAVTAYLQDMGGVEVTVEIPEDAGDSAAEDEEQQRKPYESAEDIISEIGCGACHKVGEDEGEQGPDLTKIGAIRSAAHIRKSILDPNAELSKGFEKDLMPNDYGTQLYASELEMLVEYLAKLK
tara:strand:- start:588 stop:1400 length:813 start_codon:yes stop_codon:yes gene_type:complete